MTCMYIMEFFLCCNLCTIGFSGCFLSLLEHIHIPRKNYWVPECFSIFKAVFLSSILQKHQQLRTPTLSFMLIQVLNKGRIVYSWNLSNKPVVLIALSHRYLEKDKKEQHAFSRNLQLTENLGLEVV